MVRECGERVERVGMVLRVEAALASRAIWLGKMVATNAIHTQRYHEHGNLYLAS
jgi:hypothetical protein